MGALKKHILSVMLCCLFLSVSAQPMLTEDEALDLALKNSPAINSATLQEKQSKQLQKAAINLPNPEVIAESPTGNFYTVGVLQSLDFPSVYAKQFQLQKQQMTLAGIGKALTENDVRFQVKSLYLSLQYYDELRKQLKLQDSLYNQIKLSAGRGFEAGQFDYLEKTYAESQYGEIHNQYLQAQQDYETVKKQLLLLTGLNEEIQPSPLERSGFSGTIDVIDSSTVSGNLLLSYYRQNQLISRKSLQLERNKFLPGLIFGYLNQGEKTTELNLKFRGGITVPLWFWQYMGGIQAAKTGTQIAQQTFNAQQFAITTQMQEARGNYMKFRSALDYYETAGLKNADDVISTSTRFLESGQSDLIAHLRNINEAYNIRQKYFETLKNYNQSVFQILYLTGHL